MGSAAGDEDQRRFAALSDQLADGIVAAIAPWVEGSVERVLVAWSGSAGTGDIDAAGRAGDAAAADVGPRVRDLLGRPIDEQTASPLSVIREATPFPTRVLAAAGVPPVVRDPRAEELFPDDAYDLTPASFGDLDPALHELGIEWGAAKAHLHRRRHR